MQKAKCACGKIHERMRPENFDCECGRPMFVDMFKKTRDEDWIGYALLQLIEQFHFTPSQADLQVETCANFFKEKIDSIEQQAAEKAARAVRDAALGLKCELASDDGEEGFCACCDNRIDAASSAAAPFLKKEEI